MHQPRPRDIGPEANETPPGAPENFARDHEWLRSLIRKGLRCLPSAQKLARGSSLRRSSPRADRLSPCRGMRASYLHDSLMGTLEGAKEQRGATHGGLNTLPFGTAAGGRNDFLPCKPYLLGLLRPGPPGSGALALEIPTPLALGTAEGARKSSVSSTLAVPPGRTRSLKVRPKVGTRGLRYHSRGCAA